MMSPDRVPRRARHHHDFEEHQAHLCMIVLWGSKPVCPDWVPLAAVVLTLSGIYSM